MSDEVSRSWEALPHDTILAQGSGHQQFYCVANNCFHGTAMQLLVILAGEDGVQRFRLQCQSPLVGEGSRRNLDSTGLMRVWPLSRACKDKVHIQQNCLLHSTHSFTGSCRSNIVSFKAWDSRNLNHKQWLEKFYCSEISLEIPWQWRMKSEKKKKKVTASSILFWKDVPQAALHTGLPAVPKQEASRAALEPGSALELIYLCNRFSWLLHKALGVVSISSTVAITSWKPWTDKIFFPTWKRKEEKLVTRLLCMPSHTTICACDCLSPWAGENPSF